MKFFKTLIAATLGTFLAFLLIFFVLSITFLGSAEEPEPYVRDNSVLTIDISGDLPSRSSTNPLDEFFPQSTGNRVSLESLRANLEKAESHENISGVLLEIDFVTAGWANLEEARRIIGNFRERSGKFVYAGTNDIGFNEKGYFLATAADSVFSPPESFFEFDGFYSEVMFMEGLLEKVGVEAEIARHGDYKGAVEPLMQQELSEENRYQLSQIVNRVSETFIQAASEKSGHTADRIHQLLNEQPRMSARFGYENGFIDSLLYRDELEDVIRDRIGLESGDEIQTVNNSRYARVTRQSAGLPGTSASDKIAVIYASGTIAPEVGGNLPLPEQQMITVDFFDEQLEQVRDDEDVKALIVRVESPGGSGSTSDAIWRKLNGMREQMPVIVSMGNVAASGGYYISMAADSILAESNTITGSIGVFATKFNAEQLFNEELGLTFGTVKTHDHADWLSAARGFSPSEAEAFQHYVDEFYDVFITKVAGSRDMEKENVDELAGGRVWTGADAEANGLVDLVGGMDRAYEIAAEKAGIDSWQVVRYPAPKSIYELLTGSAGSTVRSWIRSLLPTSPFVEQASRTAGLFNKRDPLTLYPYEITVE